MSDDARTLSIDTLGDLDDGTVRHVVNQALDEALSDCDSRAQLKKARSVMITVSVAPVVDAKIAALKGINAEVAVRTSIPPRQGNKDYLRASLRGKRMTALMPDAWPSPLFPDESEPKERS